MPNTQHPASPIRVLLLLHELSLTGAPICVLSLFESLRGETEVRILAPDAGPLLKRCKSLGPVTLISPLLHAHNTTTRIRRKLGVLNVERSLAKWQPDVIYVNSVAALKLTGSLNLPQDTPVLLHVHELEGVTQYLLRGDTKRFLELPARYIAVSQAVERMLCEDYGIESSRIARLPETIPADFAAQADGKKRASDGRFLVGGAGATDVRKGVLLWLQMAAELVSRVGADKVLFQWVGASDTFEGLFCSNIAAKLGLADFVEFVPATADPGGYFCNFDMLALTSWEDPFPLVVLENMALGVPVVCFAGGGGGPEQVGDTGVVVGEFSPAKMADAVAELIQNPDRRKKLAAAAAVRFKENFVVDVVAPKLLAELRRLRTRQ